MAKGQTEAQAFLVQFRTAYEFAQAVDGMGPLEDTKKALESENQQLGINRQTLVDELAAIRLDIEAEKKVQSEIKEQTKEMIATASVEKAEIIKQANFDASELKRVAKEEAELDGEVASKELALTLTEMRDNMAAIKAGKEELASIEKAIQDLKNKFGG